MKISVHTVRVVMEDNGYVTPKVRRTEVHDKLYEATRPGAMWHLDFLHRYINKLPIYILLIVDDWSRFITGWAIWDGERVAAVMETFEGAVERYGRPEKVLNDGGSAFWARTSRQATPCPLQMSWQTPKPALQAPTSAVRAKSTIRPRPRS